MLRRLFSTLALATFVLAAAFTGNPAEAQQRIGALVAAGKGDSRDRFNDINPQIPGSLGRPPRHTARGQ